MRPRLRTIWLLINFMGLREGGLGFQDQTLERGRRFRAEGYSDRHSHDSRRVASTRSALAKELRYASGTLRDQILGCVSWHRLRRDSSIMGGKFTPAPSVPETDDESYCEPHDEPNPRDERQARHKDEAEA